MRELWLALLDRNAQSTGESDQEFLLLTVHILVAQLVNLGEKRV